MFKSKILVILELLLVVFYLCLTYGMRTEWWCFIDVFCFFMAAFSQLMALTLGEKIPPAGKKFKKIALILDIAGVVALIGEALVWMDFFVAN